MSGRRCRSPPSPWAGLSGGDSPSAAEPLCPSPQTSPPRPSAVFRFPPAVPAQMSHPAPSPLTAPGAPGTDPFYNWHHPELLMSHRQPQSPASVGAPRTGTPLSFDADFPPLSPRSRISSLSPPSPLSPRLPALSRAGEAARRPGAALRPLAPLPADIGGASLLSRRRRRHRGSRTQPAADGSPAPNRAGQCGLNVSQCTKYV